MVEVDISADVPGDSDVIAHRLLLAETSNTSRIYQYSIIETYISYPSSVSEKSTPFLKIYIACGGALFGLCCVCCFARACLIARRASKSRANQAEAALDDNLATLDGSQNQANLEGHQKNIDQKGLESHVDRDQKGMAEVEIQSLTWSCSMCNFINSQNAIRCQTCNSPKPQADVDLQSLTWSCSACNGVNSQNVIQCQTCMSLKSKGEGEEGEGEEGTEGTEGTEGYIEEVGIEGRSNAIAHPRIVEEIIIKQEEGQ
jgi:hypothetical protein